MLKRETVRTYGRRLREWKQTETIEWKGEKREIEQISQVELSYSEYNISTGAKIREGSEDFSPERLDGIRVYRVFTWDGKKYNKGDCRWFEERMSIKTERGNRKALKAIAAKWFPSAVAIEIR